MLLKCFLIYFLLFRLISCHKSFTIVLDTTGSMQEELDVIKWGLASAVNVSNADIDNYLIVPFNDPDVGEPIIAQTSSDFLSSLNAITVSGGDKCPENSLAGIEKALQISKQQSYIFLFTDAYSKDASKLGSVENLCRSTGSQVVIFLSGYCLPTESSPAVNIHTYYEVAKACSGAVVRFDSATLRQAFTYINEVMNVHWTDVITYDTFTEYKELSFSVDSFTKTILVAVSGEYPVLEISAPDGSNHGIEKILDTRHTQVVRLKDPSIGEHKAIIRCRGKTSATLYKKYELPLRFGFSTMLPRSMSETSRRPMPGRENYILIDVSQSKMKLEIVEIQIENEQEKKALVLEENLNTGLYLTKMFVEPNKAFHIWKSVFGLGIVHTATHQAYPVKADLSLDGKPLQYEVKGYDISSLEEIKGSTENMTPQQTGTALSSSWTKPKSNIIEAESITVDFGTNATVACKVTGYPMPNISWEDGNGVSVPSVNVLLEIPSLYISYASLENVTVNSVIYCKSKNSEGEDSQSLEVHVYRPFTFDVIQTPADQTIEYGSEGKLYCEVSAYPEAKIEWYHNNTEVKQSDEIEVVPEDNALWIKNMTIGNIGEYKCQMSNEANMKSFSAFVKISGIEAPQVEVEQTNIVLKLGDWSTIECRIIKGKPSPAITWTYKSEDAYDFGPLPDGVVAEDGKLKIASAQSNHKGVYRCQAANIDGQHSADIIVELKYPPSISNSDSTVTVKEEDEVALPCKVDASPAANVRWETSQDGLLDDRHHTDRQHTHRFKALWKDSGNYHCIAENEVGRAEKTITVNVLVAPYIEAPKSKLVVVRAGENVVLPCNVMYGNPVPATKWEFIAPDSTTKVLSRYNNSSSPLHLENVNYTKEGSYLCIADNDVGTDSINIYVKIQ